MIFHLILQVFKSWILHWIILNYYEKQDIMILFIKEYLSLQLLYNNYKKS